MSFTGKRLSDIYLFQVNNRNTGKRFKICSKLTIKLPKRHYWRRSDVFIVNFEHISHIFLGWLLLTLNKYMSAGKEHTRSDPVNKSIFKVKLKDVKKCIWVLLHCRAFIVNFEQTEE